jgi:hypothetical protein
MQRTHYFQFRLKMLLVVVAALAMFLAVAGCIYREYQRTMHSLQDVYTVWEATDLLTHYVVAHGNAPQSWQDLTSVPPEVSAHYGSSSLDSLGQRVEIDFELLAATLNADAEQQAGKEPPRVISVKRNRQPADFEIEANQRLWDTVRQRGPEPP